MDLNDAFSLMPIRFWSNERWGIPTPCANKGFAHAHQVKLGRWAMRRVKGVFGDFCIAGPVLMYVCGTDIRNTVY